MLVCVFLVLLLPAIVTVAAQKTLILGSGIAGINAGHRLADFNKDFEIIEASGRVGGRIRKSTFGDPSIGTYVIEDGANWIQGTKRNIAWDRKLQYDLQGFAEDFCDVTVYDENGVLVPQPYHPVNDPDGAAADAAFVGAGEISDRCIKPWLSEQLTNADWNFCEAKLGPGWPGPSLFDDISIEQAQFRYNGFLADTPYKKLIELYSVDFEAAESAAVTSVNNTLPWSSYVDARDADLFVRDDRGYEWIVLKRGAEYLSTSVNSEQQVVFDDARLKLNSRVVQVEWDNDLSDGNDGVVVTTCLADDAGLCASDSFSTHTGDFFIPTFSLGVLQKTLELEAGPPLPLSATKNIAPRFVPPLSAQPNNLGAAIATYPLAKYWKVFFQFRFTFWDSTNFMLSAANGGKFAPVWQNLDERLPGSHIFFVTFDGERAIEANTQTDEKVIDDMLDILNTIYYDNIHAELGRNLSRSLGDVAAFKRANWQNDTLTYGMYSNMRVGQSFDSILSEFIAPRGNMYMSGEATCRRYNGYVHGGDLAGQRTANYLLNEQLGENVNLFSTCDEVPFPGNSGNKNNYNRKRAALTGGARARGGGCCAHQPARTSPQQTQPAHFARPQVRLVQAGAAQLSAPMVLRERNHSGRVRSTQIYYALSLPRLPLRRHVPALHRGCQLWLLQLQKRRRRVRRNVHSSAAGDARL